MRTLHFTVTGQTITRSAGCDFDGIVAGSRGYLFARFHFSADWDGCKKVAVFKCGGKEYPAPLVAGACEIPPEALTGPLVQVYVLGRRGGLEIPTGEVAFAQDVRH